MKENYWQEKLIDYAEGNLSKKDKSFFESHLKDSKQLQEELEDYQLMSKAFGELEEHHPPAGMEIRFVEFLEKEKASFDKNSSSGIQRGIRIGWIQMAAAVALLLLGVFLGNEFCNNAGSTNEAEMKKFYAQNEEIKKELEENKKMMIELLEEKSTSRRISAVNYSYQIEKGDDEIYQALIKAMNTDKSINVRLAAMEGLAKFGEDQKVRNALIQSLNLQTDPAVQINLINILVQLNEKNAIPQMEKIINNKDIDNKVKDEARFGIIKMS